MPVETENTTGSSSENFMKIAKIMALWAALFGRAWAAELNEDDAGDCTAEQRTATDEPENDSSVFSQSCHAI